MCKNNAASKVNENSPPFLVHRLHAAEHGPVGAAQGERRAQHCDCGRACDRVEVGSEAEDTRYVEAHLNERRHVLWDVQLDHGDDSARREHGTLQADLPVVPFVQVEFLGLKLDRLVLDGALQQE
eukprot:CAMPEP_0206126162 /NCGR_PEP_ID=MMETSP1472-20131121/20951_1 /ASSEMBLY_ACC=CAM_ASM_001108 /TAXON_ID=41880 /ORGANISM="Pycnococcus provasolii, Strain RCC251" /LENGTH=124 /DNA_ID=CAMNT_0053517159 /DNA_START=197 /DNA_END=568 /DNA_ORIENTATION=+